MSKETGIVRRQSQIVELLKSSSTVALVQHLKRTDLTRLPDQKKRLYDMQQELESLRRKWIEFPELRLDIEAEAAILKTQIGEMLDAIPRSLAEIDRAYYTGSSASFIEVMILSLVDYLNVGKNMSPAQIRETAQILATSHSHLTLEHFAYVIQRAKEGGWGQIYDRLDGVVIAGWLQKYVEEIRDQVQLRRANDHQATKVSRTADGITYRLRDLPTRPMEAAKPGAEVPPISQIIKDFNPKSPKP